MGIEVKKRGKVTRKRKPIILIAAEGKNKTEKLYFNNFNKSKNYSIIFSKDNCTDPINMIKALEKEIKERGMSKKDNDIAYCVFDTDYDISKQEKIDQAIINIKRKNIQLIKSNPCFEIWFILHYNYSTKQYNSNTELLAELKKYISDYEKNKDIYNLINDKTDIAKENAKKLEKYHTKLGRSMDGMECNPSTQIYAIIEKIQEYEQD